MEKIKDCLSIFLKIKITNMSKINIFISHVFSMSVILAYGFECDSLEI